jgi:hypothetical protein
MITWLKKWANSGPAGSAEFAGQKQIHQALAEAVVLFRGLTQVMRFSSCDADHEVRKVKGKG